MPSILKEYDLKKIALLAVFVLAVIGVIYWLSSQHSSITLIPSTPSLSTGECIKDDCLLQKAISLNDYSFCISIQDANLHDSCLTNFNDLNNAGFCDNYINKDSCLLRVALNKGTPDLCDQIISLQIKDRCYSIAPREITGEECLKITGSMLKDQCYFNLSYKTQNPDTCKSIIDENLHDSCLSGISLSASEGKYSSEICEGLKALNNKNFCFNGLAIQEKNQATCDFIAGNTNLKNNCIELVKGLQ